MKKVLVIVLAIAMILGLAACGTEQGNEVQQGNSNNEANVVSEPAEKKVLRVATKGDPTSLCWALVSNASVNNSAQHIMVDRLFEYDYKTGDITPMLATSWEMIDATHYRITLRDDVYSWNGDKLTASDVVYSFREAIASGKLTRQYNNIDGDGCSAEDDTHFILATKTVDPFIIASLSSCPYGIMVEASVKAGGGLEKMEGHDGNMPNCYTGPYIPVEWNSGSYVKFVRNEKYWNGTPYFDEIIEYTIPDATARTQVLQSGDVDIAIEPIESQVDLIASDNSLQVINLPTTNHHTLFTNTQKAPFDDVNVRRACALALDYENNIRIALSGYGKHSDDILPIGNPMYASPKSEGYESFYNYNIDKAKEYMAQSKYAGTDLKVDLLYMPSHEAFIPLIQQQWKEIGIEVVPVPISASAFYDTIRTGAETAWIVNNAQPSPYLQLTFYDGEHFDYTALNGGPGWNGGAEVTALYDKITAEADLKVAETYYKELRKILNDQVPSIPLYVPDRIAFAVSKLDGVILTQVGDINFSKAFFK